MNHHRCAVLYAGAWRLAAGLFQLHQARLDLRVHQYFPGLSVHGVFVVQAGPLFDGAQRSRVSVWLSGERDGDIRAHVPGAPDCAVVSRKGAPLFAWQVALGRLAEGDSVVDRTIDQLGWPVAEKAETNAPTLVARLIARFLERHMADDPPWRTVPGFIDNSNGMGGLGAWMQALPELWSSCGGGTRALTNEECRRALRYVLLGHCAAEDADPHAPWVPHGPRGVIFDLATAEVAPLRRPKQRLNLLAQYRENGRRLTPLTRWLEETLDV